MSKNKTSRIHMEDRSFPLKKEIIALLLLACGVFYYLCMFSYTPVDPSLFTAASQRMVDNLGGVVGAYLAGTFFFLIGGASYFLGLYFLINAILFLTNKRGKLKFLDFFVFLLCSTFIAIFFQIEFSEFSYGVYTVNAGGTIGKILGEIGAKYLGNWGMYLFVVFGAILTFILATRLSFVDALNSSTNIIGKGVGSFGNRCLLYLARIQKLIDKKMADRREQKKAAEFEKARVIVQQRPASSPVPSSQTHEITTSPPAPVPVKKKIEDFIRDAVTLGEPKILERKDKKVPKSSQQMELNNISEGYQFPQLAFLNYSQEEIAKVDQESLKMSAKILESKLKDFDIDGNVSEIHPGPVITMFEFQPAPGVKLSRINSLADDLALAMGGRAVRIISPLPNKAAIGIEIPNHVRETVWLKDVIEDDRFKKSDSKLIIALGKDTEGISYVTDLQKMPHLLVAGSTGSGKSVAINTMICSILYKARPDEVRMIMIDPKMIELSIYQDIPHLLLPVQTDPRKANTALKWAVREMERRYRLLADINARNIIMYNKKIESGEYESKQDAIPADEDPVVHNGKLPLIVIVIDEFADLMMVANREVEESVCRLAQKARAAGLHVIIATQRPSVDVITGLIKANFPARISFRVTSKYDSRTILDQVGAEHLLGMGDMLFIPPGTSKTLRMHGAYISETEIQRIVDFVKQQAKPSYNEEILKEPDPVEEGGPNGEADELYDAAVRAVCETKRASISSIQRQFRIGYNRAARLVEMMETQGIVSGPNGQGQRDVLVDAH